MKFKDAYFKRMETGAFPDGISFQDILTDPQAVEYMPMVSQEIIRANREARDVISPLFEPVSWVNGPELIKSEFVGEVTVGDVGEAMEYPTADYSIGQGAFMWYLMGKCGAAVRQALEQASDKTLDIYNSILRKFGIAFARHRMAKCISQLYAGAMTLINNTTPSQAVLGTTTGLASGWTKNGTFNVSDFIDCEAQINLIGYTPSIMMVHPMAYAMFSRDETLRDFIGMRLSGLGQATFYNGYNGSAGGNPWGKTGGFMSSKGLYTAPGEPKETQNYQNWTATPKIPSYFGMGFTIITSPYVSYNEYTKKTDVFLIDPSSVGKIYVAENETMDKWSDPARDIFFTKVRARYVPASEAAPNGVFLIKDINTADYDHTPNVKVSVADISGIPTPDRTTAI